MKGYVKSILRLKLWIIYLSEIEITVKVLLGFQLTKVYLNINYLIADDVVKRYHIKFIYGSCRYL